MHKCKVLRAILCGSPEANETIEIGLAYVRSWAPFCPTHAPCYIRSWR